MSFSFRSMFQGSAESNQPNPATLPEALMQNGSHPGFAAPPPMSAVTSPPLNAAASPFGAPMFKVASGENPGGLGAVQTSPFAAAGATSSTNAPLTVGDVLPQLPPDVARLGALPMDQPVAISNQILDDALRSGQAAVPMFEIYRVCPALFQTPVSPQDPRMIPLPASKLPRLIAAAQSGGFAGAPAYQAATPMMAAAPPQSASPFGMALQPAAGGMMMEAPAPMPGTSTPSGMLLPPRRQGPPPPLAEVGSRDASPQISLPGAPAFPVSPFAAAGAESQAQPAAAGQPFATGMGASPFGAAPGAAASPFMARQDPAPEAFAPPSASPFAAPAVGSSSPFSAPQAQSSPFSAQPAAPPMAAPPTSSPFGTAPAAPGAGMNGGSPFGSLFGDKAVPTGQPAPDAPGVGPRMVGSSPMSTPQAPASMPPSLASSPLASGPVRISLSGILKGYTAAELGFDPMVVPAWITTAMPASAVQEFLASPAPLAQLGFLIDGITDVGFRNVLNTARRDFQVRLESELLQNASAGSAAPPTLPNLSSLNPAPTSIGPVMMVTPPSGSPSMGGGQPGMMRVEPPPGFAQPQQQASPSPFGAQPMMPGAPVAASFAPPASAESFSAPAAGSPFAPSTPAPAPAPAPAFAMAQAGSPFQAPASAPAPQPAAPFQPLQAAFAPAAAPAAQAPAPFAAFQNAPSAPPQDPFAAPAQGGAPLFQHAAPAQAPAPFQAPAPAPAPAFQPASPPSVPFAFAPQAPLGSPAPAPIASLAPPPMFLETTVLPPEQKPAAPAAFNSFRPPAQETVETGFSSDQLLGQDQPPMLERTWSHAAAAAASGPLPPELSAERARPAPVIDVPATPAPAASFFDPPPAAEAPAMRAFVPPTFEDEEPTFQAPARPVSPPAPMPAPAPAARPSRAAAGPAVSTNLGVQTHDANPDQIMLRALLDTDSDLTPQRVVELTCGLPGIAACVCLQGGQAISHAGAHKPQAREFQKQATQLAQHLRALAPLIGIDGAETFTMNSGDRLMTFCFPEGAILGVLHDAEPTLGLRDKITLIARELSRMIA